MHSFSSLDHIPYRRDSHVTLGTFDGIHRGHRRIIDELVRRAKKHDARSVLITFDPHPQRVVKGDAEGVGMLTPLEEKLAILETLDLDAVLILPFDDVLRGMEPEAFVEEILVGRIGMQEFILGFNHAFGKQRRGNVDLLERTGRAHGFRVDVIPPVKADGGIVSSTRIRALIHGGKVAEAGRLLGRSYSLEGLVREGKRIGGVLGFPTANVDVFHEEKLLPADGVYAVMVRMGDRAMPAMANLGFSPTLKDEIHRIEVHIHDFTGDLYDQRLRIEFVERIRAEETFDSVEALVEQMKIDRQRSLRIIKRNLRRNTWD